MFLYRHHIIPKHAGGTDDPSNIKLVTREEHAEDHKKLYEEYGRWQDKVAWLGWAGMAGKEEISFLKNSLAHKGKKPRLGIKLSEQTKQRISESKRGQKSRLGAVLSEETKLRISVANKGRPAHNLGKISSINTRKKISLSRIGNRYPNAEKWYTVVFPDGREESIKGLNSFARNKGLNAGNLISKSGSKKHYARKILR